MQDSIVTFNCKLIGDKTGFFLDSFIDNGDTKYLIDVGGSIHVCYPSEVKKVVKYHITGSYSERECTEKRNVIIRNDGAVITHFDLDSGSVGMTSSIYAAMDIPLEKTMRVMNFLRQKLIDNREDYYNYRLVQVSFFQLKMASEGKLSHKEL